MVRFQGERAKIQDTWVFLFFKSHPRIHDYLLILQRMEGRERERNIDVMEKHRSATSHTGPDLGWNLQARYMP